MKILDWLPWRRSIENPSTWLSDPDEWLYDAFVGGRSASGVRVGRRSAMRVTAYARGVRLISGYVAKIPLNVLVREGDGWKRDPAHPVSYLLRCTANSEGQTAFDFRRLLQGHAVSTGNGYAYIDRNSSGQPIQLIPLDPERTTPVRMQGRLWYLYEFGDEMRKLRPDQVLHIKGLGWDGLVGYSVLDLAREALGSAIASRDYGSRFFQNSATPKSVLEHPGKLTPEAAKRLRDSWSAVNEGLDNAHRTAILEEGMKLHPFSVSAKDAQLLELRQFDIREIANALDLPPHKLGDTTRTSFASLEQDNQSFLDDALDPWLVCWEAEMREKFLTESDKRTENRTIEFNRGALVRVDQAARFGSYRTALGGAGWMTLNEVRRLENLPPVDDGDTILSPLNMKGLGDPDPPTADPAVESDPAEDPAERARPGAKPQHRRSRTDPRDAAVRQLVLDVLERMTRRLTTQVRRAAGKPKDFEATVSALEADHRQIIAAAVRSGVAAFVLDQAEAVARADKIVETLILEVRKAAGRVYDSAPPAGFAEAIETSMNTLDAELPTKLLRRATRKETEPCRS